MGAAGGRWEPGVREARPLGGALRVAETPPNWYDTAETGARSHSPVPLSNVPRRRREVPAESQREQDKAGFI